LDQGSVHQRRQIECQLWKEHQEHDHQQHAENEGYGSDHDLVEAPAFAHSLYYIEIEADRRCDQSHLNQDDQQNAEPDLVEAEAEGDGSDDRNRDHHQGERLDEEAEHDIEQDDNEEGAIGPQLELLQHAVDLARQPDRRKDEIEEVSGGHDQHDHGRRLHGSLQRLAHHREGEGAVEGGQR